MDWPVVGHVPSSKGTGMYAISQGPTGDLACECKGFKWRGKCRHLDEYRKQVKKENEVVVKFKLTFKSGQHVIAVIEGREKDLDDFKVGDLTEEVIKAENYLERLTGYRVHIESEM